MKKDIIDLFAGCGGLTDGFLQSKGFNTLAVVDWEKAPIVTLENHLKKKWNYDCSSKIIHFDIQRTQELLNGFNDSEYGISEGLINIVGDLKVHGIVGGPPCQAYSMAGRVQDENGMQFDYRNYLFESYVKIVNQFQPDFFVFENVEGILSAKPGGLSITDRIRKFFDDVGYDITNNLKKNALFDTSYYGVPQIRKRVIIFGVKKSFESKGMIKYFYSQMRENRTDFPSEVKTYFDDLPKFIPSESTGKKQSHMKSGNDEIVIPNHEPRFHNKRDIEIFRILTEDIESGKNKYNTSKSLIELYKKKTGIESNFHKYHVIRKDKPSNTIPAHLYKDGLRHIHPDPQQSRTITVREAARIQTFDDSFEFLGSKGDQYKMVGNAVPPKFAKIIAEVISKMHE